MWEGDVPDVARAGLGAPVGKEVAVVAARVDVGLDGEGGQLGLRGGLGGDSGLLGVRSEHVNWAARDAYRSAGLEGSRGGIGNADDGQEHCKLHDDGLSVMLMLLRIMFIFTGTQCQLYTPSS